MADGARLPLNSVCFVYYAIHPPRARAIESNRVCWILYIVAMLELKLRQALGSWGFGSGKLFLDLYIFFSLSF